MLGFTMQRRGCVRCKRTWTRCVSIVLFFFLVDAYVYAWLSEHAYNQELSLFLSCAQTRTETVCQTHARNANRY